MRKKHLPNLLSFCRVGLSFFLAFLPPQSILFVLLYLFCGLTDILDGYLARKLNAETDLGARLDSLADLCMCAMIFFAILRQVPIDLPLGVGIGAIAVIRAGNALFSKVKFGRAASIHTLANKVTGLLFFLCPLACTLPRFVFLYGTGIAALLASIEEFLIFLTSDTLNLNRKSIFGKS